jgi:FtsP/CotA-like multicopper oxidase with cupredoxin domain
VNFNNSLPEPSIVHWHGLRLPEEMDAHPRFAIPSGETYTYDFQVLNRAGTYWYHPHPHMLTGRQVYNGLAGLFIVTDDEEEGAGLPEGEYDIPLVIQDRTFDADNQFVYVPQGMMAETMGFLGDSILVNGQPDAALSVETRAYRLRFLNGSNFRIYKLVWGDGTPLTVIATDGGLLESPAQRDYVMLAPGERVELWADFSQYPVGTELLLQSLPFSGIELMDIGGMNMGGMDHGGMDMGATTLPQGSEFTVLRVEVAQESNESLTLPAQLSAIERYSLEDAVNQDNPRRFALARQMPLWTINGRSFEMESVAEDEIVRLNTLEVWEFDNLLEGDDQMAHPMHIHGVQFQIVERQAAPDTREGWETVRAGYVDEGWKDTLLMMPGERVKLLLRFEDFSGMFVYHCHTLEHEDMGMMRNYRIEP